MIKLTKPYNRHGGILEPGTVINLGELEQAFIDSGAAEKYPPEVNQDPPQDPGQPANQDPVNDVQDPPQDPGGETQASENDVQDPEILEQDISQDPGKPQGPAPEPDQTQTKAVSPKAGKGKAGKSK